MNRLHSASGVAWGIVAAIWLAACSLAPDYHVPDAAASAAYKELGRWKTATPGDEASKGEWWKSFGDPQLDALEDRIGNANQTLQSAYARFLEARAALGIASANTLPQVFADGWTTNNRRSKNALPLVKPFNSADYMLNVNVSYEIDVWGRVRNSVESAKDSAQASAADLAATDLDLRAELAGDYFNLRGLDTKQHILDETVAAYAAALHLIIRRHEGGVQPAADVAQAEGQLETAETQASDNRLRRAQMEHAIAILLGVPPAEFNLPDLPLEAKAPLPQIQPGLPSTLLERRPDVAAAERRAAAANADIGVARAAYFPVFTLEGLLGVESATPARLLQVPSTIWSFGPRAAAYLFDGGRLDAMTEQARAAYDRIVADYRQIVLNANGEVEDTLVALHQLDREIETENAAVTVTQEALYQAKLRYTVGVVTYIEVVDTENAVLGAQLSAADIHTRRIIATVQLIKALGGGWSADQLALEEPSVRKVITDEPPK